MQLTLLKTGDFYKKKLHNGLFKIHTLLLLDISSRFSSNSEVSASELVENFEEMVPWCMFIVIIIGMYLNFQSHNSVLPVIAKNV